MSHRYKLTVHPRPVDAPNSVWLATSRISRLFCTPLPVDLADLLDVVLAIYAADRKSPRNYRGPNTGHRSIELELSLRDPGRWNEPAAIKALHEMLYWLSGDDWTFDFRQRLTVRSAAEYQASLLAPAPEPPVSVSLFSGGLDSLAGLACATIEQPGASHVLVSGYTHTPLLGQQRRQVKHVRSVLDKWATGAGSRVWHMAVGFGVNRPNRRLEEKGQRTRALVYEALGVVAAVQAGTDALRVYENGIGAFNLPLTETQFGVDNYRGVHPRSLRLFEALLPAVIDRPVRIQNPYLFYTKAEMCRALPQAGFTDAIHETVSCDRFPLRIRNQPTQCGYCTSCILRRQALHASGLGDIDPGTAYWQDISGGYAGLNQTQRYGIRTMRDQVFKLGRMLDQSEPWTALCASYPQLAEISREICDQRSGDLEHVKRQILRLFRTYVSEWQCLTSLAV